MDDRYCLLFDIPQNWHKAADVILASGLIVLPTVGDVHDILVNVSLAIGCFLGVIRVVKLIWFWKNKDE